MSNTSMSKNWCLGLGSCLERMAISKSVKSRHSFENLNLLRNSYLLGYFSANSWSTLSPKTSLSPNLKSLPSSSLRIFLSSSGFSSLPESKASESQASYLTKFYFSRALSLRFLRSIRSSGSSARLRTSPSSLMIRNFRSCFSYTNCSTGYSTFALSICSSFLFAFLSPFSCSASFSPRASRACC